MTQPSLFTPIHSTVSGDAAAPWHLLKDCMPLEAEVGGYLQSLNLRTTAFILK